MLLGLKANTWQSYGENKLFLFKAAMLRMTITVWYLSSRFRSCPGHGCLYVIIILFIATFPPLWWFWWSFTGNISRTNGCVELSPRIEQNIITEPEENALLKHIMKLCSKGNCVNKYGKPVQCMYIPFLDLLRFKYTERQ